MLAFPLCLCYNGYTKKLFILHCNKIKMDLLKIKIIICTVVIAGAYMLLSNEDYNDTMKPSYDCNAVRQRMLNGESIDSRALNYCNKKATNER